MLYTCLTPGVDGVQFSEAFEGFPQSFPHPHRASLGLGRGVLARPARPGPVEQRVRPHTVFVVVRLVIPVGRVFLRLGLRLKPPPKSAPAKYAAFKGKRTERGIEWEDGNVWPCGGHKHQD